MLCLAGEYARERKILYCVKVFALLKPSGVQEINFGKGVGGIGGLDERPWSECFHHSILRLGRSGTLKWICDPLGSVKSVWRCPVSVLGSFWLV